MSDRPNILFLICHDLGRELGCYGAPVDTPNLDRLASQGICFTQSFTNSPCCSPSRGCVFTGQYAHTNGLMGLTNCGWSLPAERRTFVDLFNDAGYETVHVGHQHERANVAENDYQIERIDDGQYVEEAVDSAIDYLNGRGEGDKPFLLSVGTVEVHASRWGSTDKFGRLETYDVRNTPAGDPPGFLPDVERIREELRGLRAATNYFDREVGRLLDYLDQTGLAENTWIVLTTDHGISGARAKATLYDAGVETTLLVRGPGLAEPGRRESCLIQHIDLLPTLANIAGLETPADVQGRSFAPLLQGQSYSPHEQIFIELNSHGWENDLARAIRTPAYHLIYHAQADKLEEPRPETLTNEDFAQTFTDWYNELWPEGKRNRPQWELYHVAEDPFEKINLIDDPAHADVAADLREKLLRWTIDTDDIIAIPR